MKKHEWWFVIKGFIFWRLFIFIPVFLAPYFFKLQNNFLGGGLGKYLKNPFFWSWANFDGEHYVSIARLGYGNGEQAFFPLYPFFIRFVSNIIGFKSPDLLTTTGLIVSNIAFILALIGFYKLIRIDYSEKIAKLATVFLLVFPTSFYYGAVYTESLFLCLVVWSFYSYRREKYWLSGILGMLSSATRIIGIILLPVYLVDIFRHKKVKLNNLFSLLIIPIGLAVYMLYSKIAWDSWIMFFRSASGFGEQRSDHLISLPQVFYRYLFKVLPNLSWDYFPVIFTTLLEMGTATLILAVVMYMFYLYLKDVKVIKSAYWLFLIFGYLIPTLSGSFSSLPRYAAILFPLYIFAAKSLEKANKYLLLGIYISLAIIAFVAQMLFVRGYFVS